MSNSDSPLASQQNLLLQNHEARLTKLEEEKKRSSWKSITTSASTSALFLGLVLSGLALYDALVSKPEAERVARIAQFNQAVNSAAKVRQDLAQLQATTKDPQLQLYLASMATPQVLNNLSTAKALLKGMNSEDVEIPQLSVLISEAFYFGDLASAKAFVDHAVRKTNLTPYLRSEARRYEARYLFSTGNPVQGRKSFESALDALGDADGTAAARAYNLADHALAEFTAGDCAQATTQLQRLAKELRSTSVSASVRSQILNTLTPQIEQADGFHCRLTQEIVSLLSQ